MSNPIITVVIAAGIGRSRELVRAIKSITASKYDMFEIIVVDNSKNPRLQNYITAKFPGVKFIRMPQNLGILAINIGFANARGDYVLIIDDDCTVRPDTLEQIINTFNTKNQKVAVLSANIYNPIYKTYTEKSKLDQNIIKLMSFADGAAAFRRMIFTKAGYFDNDFFCWQHGDDLAIRILDAGYEIHFAKDIMIYHFERKKGLRKDRAFLDMRNAAWFNLKHFSPVFFPFLVLRNLISLILLPFKQRSSEAIFWGLAGYMAGWLTFPIPLKKRKEVSIKLQKDFLFYYLFNRFPKQ